jgi:hypothetical protein
MPMTPNLELSIAKEVAVLIREARRMRDEARLLQNDERRQTLLAAARISNRSPSGCNRANCDCALPRASALPPAFGTNAASP